MKDLLKSRAALRDKNKHIQDPTVPNALPIGDPFERPCHMQRRSEANTKEQTHTRSYCSRGFANRRPFKKTMFYAALERGLLPNV